MTSPTTSGRTARTALITGGAGLVGSHIVERLLADGWTVRALVRDAARAGWLSTRGAEPLSGDILDPPTILRSAKGCQLIVHAAAAITQRGDWEHYRRLNVDGTRHVLAAAERVGARLLHVSSVAVYGPQARYDADGRRTDESTPLAPLPEAAHYARSKRESEALVLEAHEAGRVWATAVRPSVVYGPRDRQFIPRVARLLRYGIVPLVGSGETTLAVVHAANVADGAVLAATSEVAGGKAYNLANDFDMTAAEFFRLAAEGLEVPLRVVHIPLSLARGVMALVRRSARRSNSPLRVALDSSLNFVTRDNPFSSELAQRELGWVPTVTPAEGVPASFRWWRQHH